MVLINIKITKIIIKSNPIFINLLLWQKKNCYWVASFWWWGDSAVAGPDRGSPRQVYLWGDPPAAGDIIPNSIHGLNGAYDLASFSENSAGTRPLQGNQVGQKLKTETEFFMNYFDFSGLIFLKRRSQQPQIKISQDLERIINNQEQASLTKETKEKENRILTINGKVLENPQITIPWGPEIRGRT